MQFIQHSVVAEEFTNVGQGITGHLTQIANAITALETDITWDGLITSASSISTNVVSNSIGFLATLNVGLNQWSIVTNVTGFPAITPTMGDSWSTLNGHYIAENSATTNRLFDAVAIGDIVTFTWGAGSASFPVVGLGSRSTLLGDAFDITGTIGRTFTSGESFTLVADVGTSSTSSITLDLGTETNIDSSFTISGGLNNINTLVNTDGAPGTGVTVATTVTVLDPEASEVASQTFGVSNASDNNVDAVGNFINDAVNQNTESPVDFTSEYGSGVLTLLAQEAGNTNPWTIVIDNNGATAANAGNLSTSTVQTGEIINQADILTVKRGGGN